ncbi:hypothetical protein Cp4451_02653 [Clostridium perfringens NCTC 8239]|nr:hypothetical protein [Clostridium perfringens NCTC 8239]
MTVRMSIARATLLRLRRAVAVPLDMASSSENDVENDGDGEHGHAERDRTAIPREILLQWVDEVLLRGLRVHQPDQLCCRLRLGKQGHHNADDDICDESDRSGKECRPLAWQGKNSR